MIADDQQLNQREARPFVADKHSVSNLRIHQPQQVLDHRIRCQLHHRTPRFTRTGSESGPA